MSDERTFMEKPSRFTTLMYYPDKVDCSGFVRRVQRDLPAFFENMKKLNYADKEKYMEQWMETFLAWFEIEYEEK